MKKDCFTSLFCEETDCLEDLNEEVQDYINEFCMDYENVRITNVKLLIDNGWAYKDISVECWDRKKNKS